MIVTVFKDVFEKETPIYRGVDVILEAIRSGKYANKIHQIRNTPEPEIKRNLKMSLVSICFSGTFKRRYDNAILKHSGLVILDFDHVTDIEAKKKQIIADKHTFAAFISPSGDGLKVLVKIPDNSKDHEAHYLALLKKYPELDSTSKNLSRVCFISYDPEIYVNHGSDIWTDKIQYKQEQVKEVAPAMDYKKLQIIADLIRNSTNGEKHHNLIKASRLAGGFISGGIIDEYEAIRVLQNEINNKDIDNFKGACKTISDGIEYGKKEPIYEKDYPARLKTIIEQDIIIEDEPARDLIRCKDVEEKIIYSYTHGTSQGETTHFPNIDRHFRHKRGEITLMHGIGNHGKSAMMLQLLLVKAVKDNYKYGVFCPENMPVEEFYKDLIHSYIGKSTEKHHSNQMSLDELKRGMEFIDDHFFLIYPEQMPTPEYINKRFRELIIKHGIDGCLVDPYNQLDNDISKNGGREDQYLSVFLTKCKKFAVEHDVFYYIIAHPKGGLKKEGKDYDCPTVFDLSGGAMWNNKCDNILVTHRPFYTSDKSNPSSYFRSQKIKKQKLNGVPGDVVLNYDFFSARFTQEDGHTPLESKPIKKDEYIQPNINFYERIDEEPF
jgi:hypothetical protein